MNAPCRKPCDGCALSPGAAANKEPENALKAQLCVLGGLPFLCHHGQNWQDEAAHKRTPREARQAGMVSCAGWKREVKALAAKGYYREVGEVLRVYGMAAIKALERYIKAEPDSKEKKEAFNSLSFYFGELQRHRRKVIRKFNQKQKKGPKHEHSNKKQLGR